LGKKLYVGNLPFTITESELRTLFERHGTVESVSVITDRETGRSRGFAFVEMDASSADAAMRALDGSDMGGRTLRVNEANERGGGAGGGGGGGRGPGGPRGGGGGGGRGGFGGGGGGGGGGGRGGRY
jgi:RNA recognition motif-containing protein